MIDQGRIDARRGTGVVTKLATKVSDVDFIIRWPPPLPCMRCSPHLGSLGNYRHRSVVRTLGDDIVTEPRIRLYAIALEWVWVPELEARQK